MHDPAPVRVRERVDALRRSLEQSRLDLTALARDEVLEADLLGPFASVVLERDGREPMVLFGAPESVGGLSVPERAQLALTDPMVCLRGTEDSPRVWIVAAVKLDGDGSLLAAEVREPYLWTGGDVTATSVLGAGSTSGSSSAEHPMSTSALAMHVPLHPHVVVCIRCAV